MTKHIQINIYQIMLLPVLFMLAGCDEPMPPQQETVQIINRSIATTYKVKSERETEQVQCYRIQDAGISTMTALKNDQLVEIVAIEEGLRQFEDKLWLRIYPRLTHRPACYVNINNLIPYS